MEMPQVEKIGNESKSSFPEAILNWVGCRSSELHQGKTGQPAIGQKIRTTADSF
jgi:hypothetical protein